MAIHIHPLDLPPRYYKPIGQISAGWGLTEALLQSAIWRLHKIKDPKRGRLFTYRPSSVEKLKIFKLTMEKFVTDHAIKAAMKKLHDEASGLRGKRNNFSHGLWGRMPSEPKIWKVFYIKDTDDTFILKREIVTLQNLQDLAAKIRALNVGLKQFLTRIGAPPP